VKKSANDHGIHNASCENRTPCVFPSQNYYCVRIVLQFI